jgi:hypothetical protein
MILILKAVVSVNSMMIGTEHGIFTTSFSVTVRQPLSGSVK